MPPIFQTTLKRIHREVADLKREDLGSMTLTPSEDSLFVWRGTIPGPEGSVYEGGEFEIEITLATDYPYVATFHHHPACPPCCLANIHLLILTPSPVRTGLQRPK